MLRRNLIGLCILLCSFHAQAYDCRHLLGASAARGPFAERHLAHYSVRASLKPKIDFDRHIWKPGDWKLLVIQNDFQDQYGNQFEVRPDYNYLNLRLNDKMPSQISAFEYFRQTVYLTLRWSFLTLRQESQSKNELRRLKRNYPYLKHLLFFEENKRQTLSPYYQYDLNQNDDLLRVLDLNMNRKMGGYTEHHDHHVVLDYTKFLLEIYQKRLGINNLQAGQLQDISMNLISRSTLVDWQSSTKRTGVILVSSENPQEKLPVEVLHNIDVRQIAKLSATDSLVEVGRYGKEGSGGSDEANNVVKMAATLIAANPANKFIIIEVDAVRRRLWGRFGFRDLDTSSMQKSGQFYKSKTDFLMISDVQTFTEKVLRKSR